MFNQTLDNIIPKYCEKCGNEYEQKDIVVTPENIANLGQMFNIKCSCSKCKNIVVMKVGMKSDTGMVGVKNIGKMFNEDSIDNSMLDLDPLAMDDLLIFYEYLEQLKPITLIQKID